MKRAGVLAGVAFAGALAVSGCGWFSSSSSSSSSSKSADPCPTAVILRPLANTAVFGTGAEHRPDNVAFYGILSEADLKCEPRGDAVRITLDAVVAAERGPVARGDSVDLPYFVAVTAPDHSVLSKKPLTVRIAFEGGQKRAGVTDHIEETIPLDGRQASDLDVVLGFQQSPDVVDFYKRFRGR